ncbi:hypothetical protein [Deinococcus soli (ex Cha et al. 2016)]|uniref:Uncharacterized protein n=2 Tax=Deinococcus soli (ex Cha et al. 2016) TaxID=1309411 RepID=A0AAE3XII4_9DEIO|nr:hypothetical protein [Deinococcus soli (ex Cha et al. 2016)]MDR6221222.1 hypothetical protein [Deinococcus soli (ex Cha et al. 2016)]MDR6331152.1 hypothetical protein [Deinococcus soli (ex Cha et al. 2016)]MDR6754315.1 hypothetical protein [Deinococcus soli (ex Cha et al. 2016)]
MKTWPRTPRTPEQASERNAKRWNDRRRARLPLFMDAGLEGDLIRTGVLRDRRPDHQVRLNEDLRERLAALETAAAVRGEQFRRAMKSHCPETYPAVLRQVRRLRALAPSLRRAMHTSDHWLTALRRALPEGTLLVILDEIWPEHAQTLRQLADIDARIQRKTALGQVNPWHPVD